jgi:hypothetical protein
MQNAPEYENQTFWVSYAKIMHKDAVVPQNSRTITPIFFWWPLKTTDFLAISFKIPTFLQLFLKIVKMVMERFASTKLLLNSSNGYQ